MQKRPSPPCTTRAPCAGRRAQRRPAKGRRVAPAARRFHLETALQLAAGCRGQERLSASLPSQTNRWPGPLNKFTQSARVQQPLR